MENLYFTDVIKNIDTAYVSGAVFGLSIWEIIFVDVKWLSKSY